MARPHRFGTALSAIAIAAALGGCAGAFGGSPRVEGGFAGKSDPNVGLALRANSALQAGNYAAAIEFGERAVAKTPNDAGYRSLLGNAYFGAGRFASAESAYKDSLSLISNQPQVILKLVLVSIAQGKNAEALSFLAAGQEVLDAADYGLAMALAGEPAQAIMVLDSAARQTGADSRVRQNLALAHAIAGNWEEARTIAAQDLPANLVDARIQQWMSFAKPVRPSDQIASLMQITPAAADPGQPVRLALRRDDGTRMAAAQPAAEVQAQMVALQPQPAAEPPVAMALAEPMPEPAIDVPPPLPAYVPPAAEIEFPAPSKVTAPVRAASFVPKAPQAAPRATGKSNSVVQLGAYSSRERVAVAWAQLTKRYPALEDYSPVTARFDGPRGTVYRLSVKGFGSEKEALNRCQKLKSKGGACFVRSVAGDSPVRLASR